MADAEISSSGLHTRYKLCVIMYGGGRSMWYPRRRSFLLGSAVVGDGGRGSGDGVQVCAPHICGRISDRSKIVCEGGIVSVS